MDIQRINQPTMTSLQIAEIAGKPHNDVMKAIRRMEKAWEKVCGGNFSLTYQEVVMPNGGTRQEPCYELTKEECLYIATKFNDEARARLVMRWMQLESERIGQSVDMAEIVAESRAAAKELNDEAARDNRLPCRNLSLSQNALILYSYLRRNLPRSPNDFPFISNANMEMQATGLSRTELAAAWALLESTGYILTKETAHGKVFMYNPTYP